MNKKVKADPRDNIEDFTIKTIAGCTNSFKSPFTKKVNAVKDEYLKVIIANEKAFAEERKALEAKYDKIRSDNAIEFQQKLFCLKTVYHQPNEALEHIMSLFT